MMKPLTEEERLQGRTEIELTEECFNHTKNLWKRAKFLENTRDKKGLKKLLKKWCFTDIYAIEKFGEFKRKKLERLKNQKG